MKNRKQTDENTSLLFENASIEEEEEKGEGQGIIILSLKRYEKLLEKSRKSKGGTK